MAHGSRLMAHASGLVAQGSWPRKTWRWVPQAWALAPNFSWPWAMSHEPLTIYNRLIDESFNSKFQCFKVSKFPNITITNVFWIQNVTIPTNQRFDLSFQNARNGTRLVNMFDLLRIWESPTQYLAKHIGSVPYVFLIIRKQRVARVMHGARHSATARVDSKRWGSPQLVGGRLFYP